MYPCMHRTCRFTTPLLHSLYPPVPRPPHPYTRTSRPARHPPPPPPPTDCRSPNRCDNLSGTDFEQPVQIALSYHRPLRDRAKPEV